jgi:hypothetical protein
MRFRVLLALMVGLPILAQASMLSELDQFGCVAYDALRLDVAGVEECFNPASTGGDPTNWVTIWKPFAEGKNDETLSNDAHLGFIMAPDTTYAVRGTIFFLLTAANGLRFTFSCPDLEVSMWDTQWTVPDNPSQTASPKNIADERRVYGEGPGTVSNTTCASPSAPLLPYTDINMDIPPAGPERLGRIEIRGLMGTGEGKETFAFLWGAIDGTQAVVLPGSYIEYLTF